MEYTGERMVPERADADTFWEHVYRYHFALPFVLGKRTLDIACGEGYGAAALLRAGASSVLGVDVDIEASVHAARRYRIETMQGDAMQIPVPTGSVDAVVSFETIEHLAKPELFLDECLRVIHPGGVIVISTPNRQVYRELAPNNRFHCSELSVDEFRNDLESRFRQPRYYSQRPRSVGLFDLRGLAADFWPGRSIRGVGRISATLAARCCAHLRDEATAKWRLDPVSAVMHQPSKVSRFLDRYAITRCTIAQARRAVFMIAVAWA
jgi:SAM-dependent methyltransferase